MELRRSTGFNIVEPKSRDFELSNREELEEVR